MADYLENLTSLPFAPLGIIAMPGCEEIGKRIDYYLTKWRKERDSEFRDDARFVAYERDTYMIDISCPRFGSGEAKGVIRQSVRGLDIYIICDVFNHTLTYKMYGPAGSYESR